MRRITPRQGADGGPRSGAIRIWLQIVLSGRLLLAQKDHQRCPLHVTIVEHDVTAAAVDSLAIETDLVYQVLCWRQIPRHAIDETKVFTGADYESVDFVPIEKLWRS